MMPPFKVNRPEVEPIIAEAYRVLKQALYDEYSMEAAGDASWAEGVCYALTTLGEIPDNSYDLLKAYALGEISREA